MDAEDIKTSLEIAQTQLKFTLWFIGLLMTVLSFFIIRAFNAQAKKDEAQDDKIDKIGETMEAIRDLATSMRVMLAKHEAEIGFVMKNIEKATKS
jgi:hypothetical protein